MSTKTAKILVVDDDEFMRDVLSSLLEDGNFSVITAGNGAEAFSLFTRDDEIDLIISDMNMPEMNGVELIAKIRQQGSDVPVIILTGDEEMSAVVSAVDAGASDYLMKDEYIQDMVIPAVKTVLEKTRL